MEPDETSDGEVLDGPAAGRHPHILADSQVTTALKKVGPFALENDIEVVATDTDSLRAAVDRQAADVLLIEHGIP